ncbi:Acyltransferase family protein [anaerobic digester metagenome]
MMNIKVRNSMVEIWRLIFSLLIVACHTTALPWYTEKNQLFRSASIGVEFFFILSGYLMAQSANGCSGDCTNLGRESRSFVLSKIKKVFPSYLFALFLGIAIENLLPSPKGQLNLLSYVYYIWDILFLRVAGLQGNSLEMAVGASWYLSAMFLAMLILYPLLRKNIDIFKNVLAPLLSMFILGWFSNVYGTIKFQLDFRYGFCLGLLRAIAELCVGCTCFWICEWVRNLLAGYSLRLLATVGEIGSFLGAIWIARCYYRSQTDFICVFLFAVGLVLSFSGLSFTNIICQKLQLRCSGKFSLALYLNHVVWIRMLFRWKIPISFNQQVFILLSLSIISAIACVCTIELIKQIWCRQNIKQQIRSI